MVRIVRERGLVNNFDEGKMKKTRKEKIGKSKEDDSLIKTKYPFFVFFSVGLACAPFLALMDILRRYPMYFRKRFQKNCQWLGHRPARD